MTKQSLSELVPLNPRAIDERTIAERKWREASKAPAPQKPCDIGIFSDEHQQQEMFK